MSDELKEIRELLQTLVTSQALHSQEQQALRGDVEQIKHVLIEGNGTPAMTVRVAIVENELERVKEERNDAKMPRSFSVGLAVSILLGLLGILSGFVNS